MANVLEFEIVVSEFELKLDYCVHVLINILGEMY